MSRIRVFGTPLALALALGCATVLPPPSAESPEASAIGIKVEIRDPFLRIFNHDATAVYFAHLDEQAEGEVVLPSNYTQDGYAYLLNAKPGSYRAVAAVYVQESSSTSGMTPVGGGVSVGVGVSQTAHITTYFPSDLIETTLVTVGPSDLAFMGEFVVNRSIGRIGDAEPAQMHYYRRLAPGDEDENFFLRGAHHEGSVHESDQSLETRRSFLESARKRLATAGWAGIFQTQVGAGPPE